MKRSDKPLANPVVVFREEFDKWGVLFNPDNADAVGINPVGIVAWNLLDGQHDLKDIVAAVKDSFLDVPDAVGDHVTAFINDLIERGFAVYELEDANQ